ncbi:MAG TPA: hypothetical protein VGD47_06520 [Steroidobacteraceae bacterium]
MKATVLALAVLWAGALFAQAPPPPEHTAHLERLATLLDLTDAQKTQVQAILQEEHAKARASIDQAKASGTTPDSAQMQALHQQIQQETIQRLTPVLSESQLKKFQVLSEMRSEMHGHFWHGGSSGGAAAPASQN